MKNIVTILRLAVAPAALALAMPGIAAAQAASAVAFADLDDAVGKTNAAAAAIGEIKIAYATQIATENARAQVLETEINTLGTAIQTLQKTPAANQTAIQTQFAAYQAKQQSAKAELQKLALPYARAKAFADEQIVAKLEAAVKSAMRKKNVSIVLQPQSAVYFLPTADITSDVVAELNLLVPKVSIKVPDTWQPGQAQAAARSAPAATNTPKPQGR